ncbi:MAG: hypothetical protein H6511_02885 [Holophagales bacterium]|nr:hypothetical protein [Holophagales bacterium]
MSLVSDALRKAQREAAEREARAKGLAPPPAGGPPLQPFRRRRRGALSPARLTAIAAILVAAAGVAYYFFSPGKERGGASRSDESAVPGPALPVKGAAAAAPTSAARPEAPGSTDVASTNESEAAAPEPASVVESRPATPIGATPPSMPDSSNEGIGAAPNRQATAPEPPPPSLPAFASEDAGTASTRQAATPTRQAAAPAEPPRRWVREADLGGGAIVRLGGIAYSDAAPLAYLNGRLIGVGEGVEGWTVRAIRRAEVELERGGERAILALR